jgi:colanic acid/amylovoran biosynthesis glycosyltransferase
VASYVSDFLKPDMWHVYRQISGQKAVMPWVFTHKRENMDRFPFPRKRVVVLPKPGLRWWRRLVHKYFVNSPWQLYRWELRHALLELTRSNAKVLHIYFGHTALHFLPLIKAFPHAVVVSYHGADAGVDVSKPGHRALMLEVFNHADLIQARSESLRQDLIQLGCPAEKVQIQRTGVPLEYWLYEPRTTPENGAWRIIQSCRLIPKKGLDDTMRAFAMILPKVPRARLILAGDGPLKADLEKLAAELGITEKVRFTGFLTQPKLIKKVQASHLFVHPSRMGTDGNREGIPNSLLEAMASGLPVIATRHGGIPEAVTHEENGLLVDENDPDALASAMLRVIEDEALAQRLGAGARRVIEQDFDRERNISLLETAYLDLMHHICL